jgi:hypothetical protein
MRVTQTPLDPDELIALVERQAAEAQERAVVAQRFAADVASLRSESRSPNGEVMLDVDTSGRLTSLRLADSALELSAADLSALILATAATAQKRVARAAVALSEEVFGPDDGVVGQLRGEFEARVGALDEDDEAGPGVRW